MSTRADGDDDSLPTARCAEPVQPLAEVDDPAGIVQTLLDRSVVMSGTAACCGGSALPSSVSATSQD